MHLEERIATWDEFTTAIKKLDVRAGAGVRWLFRGQPNSEWRLRPSLARILQHFNVCQERAHLAERQLAAQFWSRAHQYVSPSIWPNPADMIGNWILMQHYGAPTRLLDWTASPYVAAYFAVEQLIDNDGAIWAISGRVFHEAGWERDLEPTRGSTERWMFRVPAPSVLSMIFPATKTDRMAAQQTMFTVAANILADHADLLDDTRANPDGRVDWIKFTIPKEIKIDFLSQFRQMSLSGETLFPGLDGLGRGLRDLAWDDLSLEAPKPSSS